MLTYFELAELGRALKELDTLYEIQKILGREVDPYRIKARDELKWRLAYEQERVIGGRKLLWEFFDFVGIGGYKIYSDYYGYLNSRGLNDRQKEILSQLNDMFDKFAYQKNPDPIWGRVDEYFINESSPKKYRGLKSDQQN